MATMGFIERVSTLVTGGVLFMGMRAASGQQSSGSTTSEDDATDTVSVHLCTQEGMSAHYMEFLR